MKYSYQWLQSHIEEPLPKPDALKDAIIFHAFEVESIEQVGTDSVFDIKVLPDRAGDCLSHQGMAREIAGMLKLTFKEKESGPLPDVPAAIPLELKSDLCRKYTAVRIDGVKVGPSPAWLREKLESIGQRSINNIVDATNYVLFDVGQPIHAFDAEKVDGGIIVRLAHEGETIKLLGSKEENNEKALKETDLVIADYLGAIAIAGVKGGATAEVDAQTTSIIVEVANFDPVAVRKTSRRLGLITDASKRFENNFSPVFVEQAAAQVVALMLELAGGTVSAATTAGLPDTQQSALRTISFTVAAVTRLLGNSIAAADIDNVLTRYGYKYEKDGDAYTLAVPHWRADITGAHDIAEEVGRVIGYDKIPASALPFSPTVEPNPTDIQIASLRAWAVKNGYREVYTYSFRSKGEVAVARGAKGKDKLRTNLSDGLKESYELNRINAPLLGLREVKLFEIGTVFLDQKENMHIAVCDKGAIQELPIAEFIAQYQIEAAALATEGVLDHPHPFAMWSQYPFITRDLAVWVRGGADKERLEKIAATFAAQYCVRGPELFDSFDKDGRTSVAYRFVFQSFDKTLTDGEVSTSFKLLTDQIASDGAFEIR